MPRIRRFSWLNYPHLVIAQACGKASLFLDSDDYAFYIELLRQMARDRLFKVHAFCLMEKEIRLVVMPNRLMLSRIMQRIHGRHTARMNKKQNRLGHLFRGRFKSLVFNESDLANVVRSVHLWPVRLLNYRRPELYPYSSHRCYLNLDSPYNDFVANKDVLSQFEGSGESQVRGFLRFVERKALEKDDYGIKEIVPGIGGDYENASELIHKTRIINVKKGQQSSVKTLADRACLLLGITIEQLICASRRQDLVMARRLLATACVFGARRSVTEVASFLKRDKAQVSRLVNQGLDLLNQNEPFISMYESLKARGGFRENEA